MAGVGVMEDDQESSKENQNNVVQFPKKPVSELTELEKEKLRVQMLVAYLDKTDPDWRKKIAKAMRDES